MAACGCRASRSPDRFLHAPLPHAYLRRAAPRACRAGRPPLWLVSPHSRPWRRALRRSARPLRHDADCSGSGLARLQGSRGGSLRVGDPRRWRRPNAAGGHCERQPADRRGGAVRHGTRSAGARGRAAAARLRRTGLSGGHAAHLPLSRSPPRAAAPQHHDAWAHRRFDPPPDEGGRLFRVPDADPHRIEPGGRARLPGAIAYPPWAVLCAPPGAAAVQAASDDGGLRPLLPDRTLFPGRGSRAPTGCRASSTSSTWK